ncbi:MAG: YfhO family protein [Clostridiales bacterium]|nr:YfhO family protein [Clostridiales bacterium]
MSTNSTEKEITLPLKEKTSARKPLLLTCLISAGLTALIVLFTYIILGFAPFGDQALIYKDGQQQLVDLLCWFKDVLTGKASISYSFSKYLGGSNFAVFTYYLASPLNLLIVFFPKSQASAFMNILFLLKASLAALFAAYYLGRRFRPDSKTKHGLTVLLAISYAFSQYLIAQSNNIMWLDGAYMLPLMLAGVEKLISDKKSTLFIVSTSLTLIFNWYVGIIDLLFAGLWFLFESARLAITGDPEAVKLSSKEVRSSHPALSAFGFSVLRFAIGCISAILCSAAVLLPTLSMLSGRSYGKSGIGMLTDFSMIGFVPNIISNYSFGFVSVKGGVNLFAGFFVLLGVVLLFIATGKALKEKLLYGGFLLVIVLSFYFQPLVAIFSMLREVESLWYRYSYVGSFALIYLAALFYLSSDRKKLKIWMPPCIAAVFSVIVLLMTKPGSHTTSEIIFSSHLSSILHRSPSIYTDTIISKLLFPILISLILCLVIFARKKKPDLFRISAVLLALAVTFELTLSQMVLSKVYATADAPELENYSDNETALLDKIEDTSFYRIVQTTYHSSHHGLDASYNEPLAYHFRSVSSFVSAPDENSIAFLDRAGYPGYYDTIPVTVSENLALDSLLSVKYVMLPSGDENNAGLQKIASIDGFKDLYLNPYALPPVFTFKQVKAFESTHDHAPALYLNDLYRYLSNVEKDIFTPSEYTSTRIDNLSGSDTRFPAGIIYRYEIDAASDTCIPYANLITNTTSGAQLYMNSEPLTIYSTDMAPTFIRTHAINGKATLDLVFTGSDAESSEVTEAQIYDLDLTVLEEAVAAVRSNSAEITYSIDDTYSLFDGSCDFALITEEDGTRLFISIPYADGWKISGDSQEYIVDPIDGVFTTFLLSKTTSNIKMTYTVPRLPAGILLSVCGIVLLIVVTFLESDKRKKKVRVTGPCDDSPNDAETDQN